MGLFSRDKPSAPPKVVRPIVVQPADLPGFSSRLEAVERAMGGPDAPLRGAIRALSESVGGMDLSTVVGLGLDSEEFKRPWRWFARACELANAQGEYEIAPRVFLFTGWWKNLEGELTFGDYTDILLEPVPPDADRAISLAAAEAIGHLPDDRMLVENASSLVNVGGIRAAVQTASGT